jgi:hypothetical protein
VDDPYDVDPYGKDAYRCGIPLLPGESKVTVLPMNPDQLPDSWKPRQPTVPATSPDEAVVPDRESDAPEVLAAWYSGFSFAEHYRKVVQAQSRELVRAQYAANAEKITEARLDDLARLHPLYLDFLARHLTGRQKWEKMALEMRGAA